MKVFLQAILTRFSQESTWRGIIGLLTAAGVAINPELQTAIISAGLGAIGLINVLKKD